MRKPRNSTHLFLLSAVVIAGCRTNPPATAPTAPALAAAPTLSEIHVDQDCNVLSILPNQGSATGSHHHYDPAICHLESRHTSQQLEESIVAGKSKTHLVTIQEQEYLLQNVTPGPVVFVVEQSLPHGWSIDSDPQPIQTTDSKAFFRVTAEPAQIVRLHVGERSVPPFQPPPPAPQSTSGQRP